MGRSDRRWLDPVEIRRILAAPLRKERQKDGRVRYWGYVPRLKAYIRVVTLADGETVHTGFQGPGFLRMMSATFDYDRPTDALYIKLRLGESVDDEILEDGDIVVDIGPDGAPVGYEIQHASRKREFIAAVILGENRPAAAE